MSTKAIREALEWMRSDGYTVNDALAEVEAIERAATWMYEIADTAKVSREEYDHHCKTMYAIYQQAKQRAP